MAKHFHEIRDPIHVFIRLDSDERKVLDSRPFQRLRYIHQLGLTYLIYPGATHRRFEHSLGVMELAGKVYDIVAEPDNIPHESVRKVVPKHKSYDYEYWRRVLRMAALCHDLGHLPFSHGAEDLFPEGWDHERLTVEIVLSNELKRIWEEIKIQPEDVAKIAVGPKKYKDDAFDDWQAILSEIIVGDAFGVDRMDYLLRDSLHAGVAYGKFDHYRLIDTLRILPRDESDSLEPALGVEEGGLHSAEALLMARYFMYTQLYFHPVRRIYDIHLKDFLKSWLPKGVFPTTVEEHLRMTDNEVTASILDSVGNAGTAGYESAQSIMSRKHFRCIYQRNPEDILKNLEAAIAIFNAACDHFGAENVRVDRYRQKGSGPDFPVYTTDDRIVSSLAISEVLTQLPVIATDYVFVSPETRGEAVKWLEQNREAIIEPKEEE